MQHFFSISSSRTHARTHGLRLAAGVTIFIWQSCPTLWQMTLQILYMESSIARHNNCVQKTHDVDHSVRILKNGHSTGGLKMKNSKFLLHTDHTHIDKHTNTHTHTDLNVCMYLHSGIREFLVNVQLGQKLKTLHNTASKPRKRRMFMTDTFYLHEAKNASKLRKIFVWEPQKKKKTLRLYKKDERVYAVQGVNRC
jgi:hypothetical protein